MLFVKILDEFKMNVAQCESLIVNAHRTDNLGVSLFPVIDRQQITVAAFLNMFIAWETFLESSFLELMIGTSTISGSLPAKYVSPLSRASAKELVIGMQRFFDFGNHNNIKKLAALYFKDGYPFEPHVSAIYSYLDDLRTMRNASAHISSTTQTAMESLAIRLFSRPIHGITLYQLLTTPDPQSATGETIFDTYKARLIVTAELIANG